MPKFKIGDWVIKTTAFSGFVGAPMCCIIPDVEENKEPEPCFKCDTPGCLEWPTLWGIEEDEGAVAYHVSGYELIQE